MLYQSAALYFWLNYLAIFKFCHETDGAGWWVLNTSWWDSNPLNYLAQVYWFMLHMQPMSLLLYI